VTDTPDLLAALSQIRDEARETRRKLAEGEALNGTSGLRRIEEMAGDLAAQVSPEGEQ
jgi:hypothetical protein